MKIYVVKGRQCGYVLMYKHYTSRESAERAVNTMKVNDFSIAKDKLCSNERYAANKPTDGDIQQYCPHYEIFERNIHP